MKRSRARAFFLLLFLASLAALVLGAGCTTRIEVLDGHDADFGPVRTWAWDGAGVEMVEAAATMDPGPLAGLRASVKQSVEEAFAARGLRRVEQGADVLVTVAVSLERRVGFVRRGLAPQLVDSYNASASWWVEGSVVERRVYEDLRIGLSMRRAGTEGRWRAVTGSVTEQIHGHPTKGLVASLLDRSPVPRAPARQGVPPGWPPEEAPLDPERLADAER